MRYIYISHQHSTSPPIPRRWRRFSSFSLQASSSEASGIDSGAGGVPAARLWRLRPRFTVGLTLESASMTWENQVIDQYGNVKTWKYMLIYNIDIYVCLYSYLLIDCFSYQFIDLSIYRFIYLFICLLYVYYNLNSFYTRNVHDSMSMCI